jgi:hypothetical protein
MKGIYANEGKMKHIKDQVKKTNITSEQKKYINSLVDSRYKWAAIPEAWWEALQRANLVSTHKSSIKKLVPFVAYLARTFKAYKTNLSKDAKKYYAKNKSKGFNSNGLELSATRLEKIYKPYKKVLNVLQNDPELIKTKSNIYTLGGYVVGESCRKYAIKNLPNFSKWILYPVGETAIKESTITPTNSDFGLLQETQFDSVDFDLTSALNQLDPNKLNVNDYQLTVHLLEIAKKRWYCTDGSTGRIYHIFSNLSKDYRKYIKINGEEVVNIDMRASQPAILGKVLFDNKVEDSQKLFEKLSTTRIYDYLFNKYQPKMDKKSYKISFLTSVYAETSLAKRLKIYRDITNEFPGVTDWIEKQKKQFGYQNLAHRMQKIESDFIFETLKLVTDITNTITVHDSFIVPYSMRYIIQDLVNEQIDIHSIPSHATIEY